MPQTTRDRPSEPTVRSARTATEIETYFSNYKLETIPSFESMIADYCRSEIIYEDLASMLEDIGQDFCYLSDQINREIKRRRSS